MMRENMSYGAESFSVEAPLADESITAPYELKIYVPSTTNYEGWIGAEEFKSRVEEVQSFLSKIYGGFTSLSGSGGYVSDIYDLIEEPVVVVSAFASNEDYERTLDSLEDFLRDKQTEWGQEVIGFEFENDYFMYPLFETSRGTTTESFAAEHPSVANQTKKEYNIMLNKLTELIGEKKLDILLDKDEDLGYDRFHLEYSAMWDKLGDLIGNKALDILLGRTQPSYDWYDLDAESFEEDPETKLRRLLGWLCLHSPGECNEIYGLGSYQDGDYTIDDILIHLCERWGGLCKDAWGEEADSLEKSSYLYGYKEAESFSAEEKDRFAWKRTLREKHDKLPYGATWEETLIVEIMRLRGRLEQRGFDPHAKIGDEKYAESFGAENEQIKTWYEVKYQEFPTSDLDLLLRTDDLESALDEAANLLSTNLYRVEVYRMVRYTTSQNVLINTQLIFAAKYDYWTSNVSDESELMATISRRFPERRRM